jgi:hypothetical protein
VFLSSTVTIPLTPYPLDSPSKPLKPSRSIRSVLHEGIRNTFSRRTAHRPSRWRGQSPPTANAEGVYTAPDSAETFHSFNFPLSVINDHDIPSTISVSRLCRGGIRGRWYAEGAQIAYKLTAEVYPVGLGDVTRTLEEECVYQLVWGNHMLRYCPQIRSSAIHRIQCNRRRTESSTFLDPYPISMPQETSF